jgi:hypothetical protein
MYLSISWGKHVLRAPYITPEGCNLLPVWDGRVTIKIPSPQRTLTAFRYSRLWLPSGADAVAARSEGRAFCAYTLNRGFESRLDVCPWFFYVVLACVGRGLATRWSVVEGVLPYVSKYDYETELTETRAHWGCRATDDDVRPHLYSQVFLP